MEVGREEKREARLLEPLAGGPTIGGKLHPERLQHVGAATAA